MDDELKKLLADKWEEQKKALAEAQKNNATKAELDTLIASVTKQGQELADFIESQQKEIPKDFDSAFESFLSENKEELARIAKAKAGEVEFIFDAPVEKAVGDMTTSSGGDAAAAPANINTSLSRIRLRNDNKLINLCNTIKTSGPVFPYTETEPKDGNYAFVAQGAEKPQIDFKWTVRYAEPYKIAAYEVFTEEVIKDISRMMSTARGFLKDKHDLYKANAIYFSAGTAGIPKGATVYGRTFVAGGMALKVVNPNIMDVINAAITDVYVTHNYSDETPYQPNLVLMNPIDFFVKFQAAKDGNALPLYGGVTLYNEFTVGPVRIIPWEKIPTGKIFVGDMSKYNISNWVRYSVRIGWINEQFIENKFTMVGESRFHAFVKNFDEQAFIYDDIATIETAIKKV